MSKYKVKQKQCASCNEVKPVYLFNRNKKTSDQLSAKCSECILNTKKPTELDMLRTKVPKLPHSHWNSDIKLN